jgi:hypothetical protein
MANDTPDPNPATVVTDTEGHPNPVIVPDDGGTPDNPVQVPATGLVGGDGAGGDPPSVMVPDTSAEVQVVYQDAPVDDTLDDARAAENQRVTDAADARAKEQAKAGAKAAAKEKKDAAG